MGRLGVRPISSRAHRCVLFCNQSIIARPRPFSEIHRIARIGDHLVTGRRRLVRAPDCGLAKHRRQKGEVLGPCRAILNVLHVQQFSSSAEGLPAESPCQTDSQRFFGRELLTVRSTQTVTITASVMSTANPLLPEIALIMVTSLNAPYSAAFLSAPERRVGAPPDRPRVCSSCLRPGGTLGRNLRGRTSRPPRRRIRCSQWKHAGRADQTNIEAQFRTLPP